MIKAPMIFFLSAIFIVSPGYAQNFLANPDFETDTAGWQVPGVLILSHTMTDGFNAAGAAEVAGVLIQPPFSNTTGIQQCFQLDGSGAPAALEVSAAAKLVNFEGFMPQIVITTHADDSCDSIFLGQQNFTGFLLEGEWGEMNGALAPISEETQSIRFTIVISTSSSDPGATVRFDDAFFGVQPLFADDFEGGSTDGWDLVVP